MPHIWNEILVVTKEELVPKFWNTLDSLRQEIWRYKDRSYGIKQVQRGGNGRIMLISFDSLPNYIQESLGDPRKISNPLELFYKIDIEAVSYYKEFKRNDKFLLPSEYEKYIINASVLQATTQLEIERTRLRKTSRGVLQSLCTDVVNFNEVLTTKLKSQPHNLPTNLRRFSEAYRNFKNIGYYSIIKDPHGKGKQNARKVTDDTLIIINSLFSNIKHKPTPTEIYRYYDAFLSGYAEVYNEQTGELYNPKEFPKISESTVTLYLNKWENKLTTHKKRSGDRQKHQERFKIHHQLEQPKFSNSLISIDDRQPPFNYAPGKRVWFYVGVDLASGAIINWVHGKSKEGIILDFYRQLVRNYVEWGVNLPFGLECESSLNSSFKETLLKPGAMFQSVRIEANNARGKAIERYNRTFRYEYERMQEGWLARPNAQTEAYQKNNEAAKILPYESIVNNCLGDIEFHNNLPSKQNPKLSRWEYFIENQSKDLQPIQWNTLLPLLGYHTKSSCRVGYISLQGQKRALAQNGVIAVKEELISILTQIEGKELDIYWLDNDEGKVLKALVYHHGRYICEILEMPKYNRAINERTAIDEEARKLQTEYVMTVENFEKSQRKNLQPINIIDNTPKTLNNKFKISQRKDSKPMNFEEAEIIPDNETQEETLYNPQAQQAIRSWRANF